MTTTPVPAAPPMADTKSFRGRFRVQRIGGGKARKQHATFDIAEGEARRLLAFHPHATFLVMQEVARVKLKPASRDPDDMPDATTWATAALDGLTPAAEVAAGA